MPYRHYHCARCLPHAADASLLRRLRLLPRSGACVRYLRLPREGMKEVRKEWKENERNSFRYLRAKRRVRNDAVAAEIFAASAYQWYQRLEKQKAGGIRTAASTIDMPYLSAAICGVAVFCSCGGARESSYK